MARLVEICAINMGQSPESSTYNEDGNGLPFFQGNADFGEIHPRVRIWCNEPTKIAKKGDILISVRAPIGALNIANTECCIGRGLAALTVNESICNQKYLWYAISGKVDELNAKGTGSTFKAISKGILSETEIPIIPLEKQKQIGTILDRVFLLIALRKKQLQKLDDLVKARFVEMFGDPINNPKGWEKRKLVDVCTKLTDGTHFSPESFESGDYKYVTAKNIRLGGFDFTNITYIPESFHRPIYARCNPEKGDVLYIKDGVTTGIALVNTLDEEFTMLSSVALLKQNRAIMNGYFLCGLLNNSEMYSDIRGNMGGAAITRLTIAKLNEIMVIVPPIELQEQFATFVSQVDKSKLSIQQSLEKLETLKQSLMQQYFG